MQHALNWITSDLPVGTPITDDTPVEGDAPRVSAGMINNNNNNYYYYYGELPSGRALC